MVTVNNVKRCTDKIVARYQVPLHVLLRVGERSVERWRMGWKSSPESLSLIPAVDWGVMRYLAHGKNVFKRVEGGGLDDLDGKGVAEVFPHLVEKAGQLGFTRVDIVETLGVSDRQFRRIIHANKANTERRVSHHTVYCAMALMFGFHVDVEQGTVSLSD